MSLDKGTRNIVIVSAIIGLGSLAYWYFSIKKEKREKRERREEVEDWFGI
jgi:hypothetical protein